MVAPTFVTSEEKVLELYYLAGFVQGIRHTRTRIGVGRVEYGGIGTKTTIAVLIASYTCNTSISRCDKDGDTLQAELHESARC